MINSTFLPCSYTHLFFVFRVISDRTLQLNWDKSGQSQFDMLTVTKVGEQANFESHSWQSNADAKRVFSSIGLNLED